MRVCVYVCVCTCVCVRGGGGKRVSNARAAAGFMSLRVHGSKGCVYGSVYVGRSPRWGWVYGAVFMA